MKWKGTSRGYLPSSWRGMARVNTCGSIIKFTSSIVCHRDTEIAGASDHGLLPGNQPRRPVDGVRTQTSCSTAGTGSDSSDYGYSAYHRATRLGKSSVPRQRLDGGLRAPWPTQGKGGGCSFARGTRDLRCGTASGGRGGRSQAQGQGREVTARTHHVHGWVTTG